MSINPGLGNETSCSTAERRELILAFIQILGNAQGSVVGLPTHAWL